jgi:carboxyl-terminal processing protease
MTATLQRIGFQVDQQTNLPLAEMTQSIEAWLRKAVSASVRLLFFSGHGAQYRGGNYLLPVDVELRSEDDLPRTAFHVDDVIDRFSRFDSGVNMLVLDACRSVPRVALGRPKGDRPGVWTPGFQPGVVAQGTLVAWATSKGAIATDDPRGGNSLFTRHFAHYVGTPGLPVEEVLKATREAVRRESRGVQVPEDHSTLTGSFCFVQSPGLACGVRD